MPAKYIQPSSSLFPPVPRKPRTAMKRRCNALQKGQVTKTETKTKICGCAANRIVISSSFLLPDLKKPKQNCKCNLVFKFKLRGSKPKCTIVNGGGASSLETSHGVSWIRLSKLGEGGFASVFLAKTRSTASIKQQEPLLMAVKSATMTNSATLQLEKRILCDLAASPYVVKCYGDEVTELNNGEKIYNLLLEFCSGSTLEHQIMCSAGVGLLESKVRCYTRDIVLGLSYIHRRGYVHCDIKPSNILLVPTGERVGSFAAKIADFGLAKPVHEKKDEGDSRRGTYGYMSPELMKDNILECPADIWALGCCVVEMLSGNSSRPDSLSSNDLGCAIAYRNEVPSVKTRRISNDAQNFMDKCLTRDADKRWTAEMLLQHTFLRFG